MLERQEASPERGTYGRYIGATVDEGDAPSGTAGATSPSDTEDRDEPLEPREETRDDVPLEQTFTIIRVRRVNL